MMSEMNLGETIRICRVSKGMKQAELAKLTGLSLSYISLLERNKRDLVMSTVFKITKALEIPTVIFIYLATNGTEDERMGIDLREKLAYAMVFSLKGTK